MLAGLERHSNVGHKPHIACPQPRAIYNDVGFYRAAFGDDARHTAARLGDTRHLHILDDLHALHPRALGHRQRHVRGVRLAVARDEIAELHVVHVQQRIELLGLGRRHHLALQPIVAHRRRQPPHFLRPRIRKRREQRTRALQASGNARFSLNALVEIGRVHGDALQRRARPALAQQPGGVPGGARCQLLAFEQHHVLPAELGEMVGDRAASHAAADDDGAGLRGNRSGHGAGLEERGRGGRFWLEPRHPVRPQPGWSISPLQRLSCACHAARLSPSHPTGMIQEETQDACYEPQDADRSRRARRFPVRSPRRCRQPRIRLRPRPNWMKSSR